MKHRLMLALVGLMAAGTIAQAADLMPVKALPKVAAVSWYDPTSSGMYLGAVTAMAATKTQISTATSVGPDTFAAGAEAGLLAGYAYGMGDKAIHVETSARWSNLGTGNGAKCDPTTPCTYNAQWAFEQSVLYVTDTTFITSLLGGGSFFPSLPLVGQGANSHKYVGLTVREEDVSATAGLAAAHKWRVSIGPNAGFITKVGNGDNSYVTDLRVTAFLPTGRNTIVPGATEKDGVKYMVSFAVKR